jgi:transposase
MEGTGVSGLPIWNVLEDRFTLLLVNARHVKAVPGRKTDVKDAEWLAEAAQAASRTKGSALQAHYRRLAARRGKPRATVAVGHAILRIVSHLLTDPTSVYEERGTHDADERHRQAIERDLVRRLQRLGNTVVLQPVGLTSWRPSLFFRARWSVSETGFVTPATGN